MGNVERERISDMIDEAALIIWHDAHSGTHTWEHIEDLSDEGPYEVRTIGFLLKTSKGGKKNHISVAQSFSTEGYVDSILHIPKKMVVSITPLERTANANQPADCSNNPSLPGKVNAQGS